MVGVSLSYAKVLTTDLTTDLTILISDVVSNINQVVEITQVITTQSVTSNKKKDLLLCIGLYF